MQKENLSNFVNVIWIDDHGAKDKEEVVPFEESLRLFEFINNLCAVIHHPPHKIRAWKSLLTEAKYYRDHFESRIPLDKKQTFQELQIGNNEVLIFEKQSFDNKTWFFDRLSTEEHSLSQPHSSHAGVGTKIRPDDDVHSFNNMDQLSSAISNSLSMGGHDIVDGIHGRGAMPGIMDLPTYVSGIRGTHSNMLLPASHLQGMHGGSPPHLPWTDPMDGDISSHIPGLHSIHGGVPSHRPVGMHSMHGGSSSMFPQAGPLNEDQELQEILLRSIQDEKENMERRRKEEEREREKQAKIREVQEFLNKNNTSAPAKDEKKVSLIDEDLYPEEEDNYDDDFNYDDEQYAEEEYPEEEINEE